jgi:hypothetical protein
MEFNNIRYLPTPETLTPDQRDHWHTQASYWAVKEEDAERAVEYAGRQRENALRMLGMVGIEQGLQG